MITRRRYPRRVSANPMASQAVGTRTRLESYPYLIIHPPMHMTQLLYRPFSFFSSFPFPVASPVQPLSLHDCSYSAQTCAGCHSSAGLEAERTPAALMIIAWRFLVEHTIKSKLEARSLKKQKIFDAKTLPDLKKRQGFYL